MEVQYISLNMTPTGVNPCFHISQYDVGRILGFIVHSGGATVDLDTYTCTIEATRSDGTAITSAVATTENIGTFEVTPTMSNKADKYRCQLVIIDANSKRIASLPFGMEVIKAAMDENSEAIEEDASLYQQYTEAVQGAIAEANANIQAEENARIAAVGAEATARANADTTLQNNIDAEASARANAITAEATARQTADNTLHGNINTEASTRAAQVASLQSQIDQLIAPSGEAPSAAEVQNARIGVDGTVYPTLGDAIRTQNSNVKSALSYKADNKYGGEEVDESITMTNQSGWSAISGNRNTVGNNNRASSPIIVKLPDMCRISCANGYLMAVFANNEGEGSAMTNIGASTWVSSVNLTDKKYKYLAINIKKSDESDFPEGTTTQVVSIIKYTEILPYALDAKVDANFGANNYILPIKSGTIGSTGIEDSRTSRLISTEYIAISNYTGNIVAPTKHSLLFAYYDVNLNWKSNSAWVSSINVSDLLGYPYVRIVARNNTKLNDDISDEINTLQIILHKKVETNSTLTNKANGDELFVNPIETGGLKQVARLGWDVYSNTTPPEQSIPSYFLAYENGCRIMLADLRITSDGEFVCRHDADLGGNTVMHLDGSVLTAEEKETTVVSMTSAQLDGYDFGIYKGLKYAGTKILRLSEFLKFCKVMNCTAMVETKVEMTAEQTQEVINMIKYYGMNDNLVWAENAFATWGGVTLPLVNAQLPNAVIHLRGGSGNLARCIEYAEQYATPEKHVEISFLNYADITDSLLATFIDKNIDAAFSEVKNAETYAGVVTSGLIYKLKSVASSYWDLGKLFAEQYRGSNILA